MTVTDAPTTFSMRALRAFGFWGFVSVAALRESRCQGVPRRAEDGRPLGGVYLAYRPSSKPSSFLAENPCGRSRGDLSKPDEHLERLWTPGSRVVYIGKADATPAGNCLHTRVRSYLRFGAGHDAGHAGGYRTWQLADSADLLIAWKVIMDEAPEAVERRLLAAHAARHGRWPFANGR